MSELDQILAIEEGIRIMEKIRRSHPTSSFLWNYCYGVGKRMEVRRDELVKVLLSAPVEDSTPAQRVAEPAL